jgi:hypothetical protein
MEQMRAFAFSSLLFCASARSQTTKWAAEENEGGPPRCRITVTSLGDTSTPDDQLLTLREAIDHSNWNGGCDISFDASLKGGTIIPLAPLSPLAGGNASINGDIDADGHPDIELNGVQAGTSHGIFINSSRNTVAGLIINNFLWSGIKIYSGDADYNTIFSCYLGTSADGTIALPNSEGVWIQDGPNQNTIGPNNVISGNRNGILITGEESRSNRVIGNLIGTDLSGLVDLGNAEQGIAIDRAIDTLIGGTNPGTGNIISGNGGYGLLIVNAIGSIVRGSRFGTDKDGVSALPNDWPGILITGVSHGNVMGPGNLVSGNNSEGIVIDGGAHQNSIVGNLIGTDITGVLSMQNYWSGILIQLGAHDNRIGGFQQGEGNVCSGNRANGITIRDEGSDGNIVVGNFCGTDVTGTAAIPNGTDGINVYGGAVANVIGPGNRIAFNNVHGVRIDGSTSMRNTITQNSIWSNRALGIRLRDGGNDQIGPPVIDNVAQTSVAGHTASQNGSIVEVFADSFHEAKTFLGAGPVMNGQFIVQVAASSAEYLAATVTDPVGNTSGLRRFGDDLGLRLLGIEYLSGTLYEVDVYGQSTQLGDTGVAFIRGCIAIRPDGQIYMIHDGGDLYRIDDPVAAAVWIGNLGYPSVEACAFASNGYLYIAASHGSDVPGTEIADVLLKVHPQSLDAQVLGEIGTDIDGLTFLASGALIGIDTHESSMSELYSIDYETAQRTFLSTVSYNLIALAEEGGLLFGLESGPSIVEITKQNWTADIASLLENFIFAFASMTPLAFEFGDWTEDGSTQLDDHRVFETCLSFSGPVVLPAFAECLTVFDWDDDGDIDLRDFSIFERAFGQ